VRSLSFFFSFFRSPHFLSFALPAVLYLSLSSFYFSYFLVFINLFFFCQLFYITYVRWPRISNFAERVVRKDGKNLDSHWCIASIIQSSSDDVRQCVTVIVRIFLTDVATHIEVQGWFYLVI